MTGNHEIVALESAEMDGDGADVVELEQLCGDVSRAALRMSGWLQEYASVRHRREKPKAKSALGLRLGE